MVRRRTILYHPPMVMGLLFGVLLWCTIERRPALRSSSVPTPPSANPPRPGRRLDRWSLPTVRVLMLGAWCLTLGELAVGRFPIGGLMAVALFSLVGAVVFHELRSFTSGCELSLVSPETGPEQGAVSRK